MKHYQEQAKELKVKLDNHVRQARDQGKISGREYGFINKYYILLRNAVTAAQSPEFKEAQKQADRALRKVFDEGSGTVHN